LCHNLAVGQRKERPSLTSHHHGPLPSQRIDLRQAVVPLHTSPRTMKATPAAHSLHRWWKVGPRAATQKARQGAASHWVVYFRARAGTGIIMRGLGSPITNPGGWASIPIIYRFHLSIYLSNTYVHVLQESTRLFLRIITTPVLSAIRPSHTHGTRQPTIVNSRPFGLCLAYNQGTQSRV
jgi:hypothetical protein